MPLLSTTNKMADQRNFGSEVNSTHLLIFCLKLIYYVDFLRLTVKQITLTNGDYKKNSPHAAMFSWFISPRLARIARHKPFTW